MIPCTRPMQTEADLTNQSTERQARHKVPPLSKELSAIDNYWEGESVFSNNIATGRSTTFSGMSGQHKFTGERRKEGTKLRRKGGGRWWVICSCEYLNDGLLAGRGTNIAQRADSHGAFGGQTLFQGFPEFSLKLSRMSEAV